MPSSEAKSSRRKCQVKTMLGCHGEGVQRLTGPKKGDPVFWCCMGCRAILNRQGVKLKEAGDGK